MCIFKLHFSLVNVISTIYKIGKEKLNSFLKCLIAKLVLISFKLPVRDLSIKSGFMDTNIVDY